MLTDREVLSTLNMLRNEHLDVRTVTLGISLFDCAAHDFDVFAYKVRAKISRYAGRLVETCNDVADKYGIPVVNKRISVSPIGVVGASFSREEMVKACRVLDEAAKNAGVDFLGGFGALVEKGMTPGERNLIDSLPEALACTDRICSSINVASSRSGINMDAVALMGQRILDVAEATRDRDGIGCAKLVVFANIPQDVPFMAGAYLGVGEPDVVINVGVSGPGVVKKAIDHGCGEGGRRHYPRRGGGSHQAYCVQGHARGRDHRQGSGGSPRSALWRGRPFPCPHSRRGRFGGGNFSERGAFFHRRARFHRRTGHAQRCGEEGRGVRLLPCGRAFRRVHSCF